MKDNFKNLIPYLIILLSFIVISFIYFYPVLQGKVMSQSDTNHAIGTSQELKTFEEKTGEYSQWTNAIFGGMPAYNIRAGKPFNIYYYLNKASMLNLPYYSVAILFIYLIGFFILLVSLKVDKWLSMVGAIAFALSSYNIIIIIAGHITKAYAIGFMAPALAGVLLLFDKKYISGAILTTLSLGMQLAKNHPQISYYTIILLGIVVLFKFFTDVIMWNNTAKLGNNKEGKRNKIYIDTNELKHFSIACGIAVLSGIFAILPNITQTWTTYEYQKYSIRGASELVSVSDTEKVSTGLDKDYANAWSYGISETFTLLVPNAKGGESGYLASNEIANDKAEGDFTEAVLQQNQYWGDQPFTSGPVYFGAIILFLFVLGLLVTDNKLKWGLFFATILSVLLSWGGNFEWFTDFIFNNVPLYNKFRTVSMTLVIASVTVPLLATLTIKEIVEKPEIFSAKKYQFIAAFALTGGLALLFYLLPNLFFNFTSAQELAYFDSLKSQSADYANQITSFLTSLENVRIAIFKADAIRSFFFILLGFGALALFGFGKIKKELLFGILGLLIIADMWFIDRRYLNEEDFSKKSKANEVFTASNADKIILKDPDLNFRVININYSLDGDGITSYFHKTISGYHGAKIHRYQDIIDTYLGPSRQMIIQSFQDSTMDVYSTLEYLDVFNMLNTRYIIYDPEQFPIVNMNVYGNAWFVEKFEFVETPDDELAKLGEVDLKRNAVIDKSKFADYLQILPKLQLASTDTGVITLTDYKPNHLTYQTTSEKDEFAVFSEIYYPEGWKAFIDGKEVEHICVNYILRGLAVPAGRHTIEFKFEPNSYFVGKKIAFISSMFIILALIGFATYILLVKKKEGK